MSAGNFLKIDDPRWNGHVIYKVALGTLDDTAESNLYDPPLRLLVCRASGNVTVTLHGDDTTDATKQITFPVSTGDVFGVFAIRKIWLTGTTVSVSNLSGAT